MSLGFRGSRSTSRLISSKVYIASTRRSLGRRALHVSSSRNAISNFSMPAMSPTMTEGGIAQWKVKEGDVFHAGDVLVEVETDKATIEVEAPDDGVLGKILAPDGSKNIPVGKPIALVAEEGDDISNLEAPKEGSSQAAQKPAEEPEPEPRKTTQSALQEPTPQPVHHDIQIQHSKPLFPSVQRLLVENGISNADQIKGTGVRGMLTKGDVLAFLGKASSPLGTYKPPKQEAQAPAPKQINGQPKPLDGDQVRQRIAAGLAKYSSRAHRVPPAATPVDFDSIIDDYLPPSTSTSGPAGPVSSEKASPSRQTSPAAVIYFQDLS